MANYYRITAYHKEKDISIIMDSYGFFEKKWQFSADLIKRGFKILEVSDIDQVIDVNITRLTEPDYEKFILRANEHGQPKYIEQEVNGITYKAVMVEGKIYIPDNTQII